MIDPRSNTKENKYSNAAGIVVFKLIDNEYHLLVLHGLDGRLDIPKGVCEPGEPPYDAAIRETEEEAGLTELSFSFGKDNKCFDSLHTYIETTKQEVVIRPNPASGITEHLGYEWMSLSSAKNADWCPYLKDAITWAIMKITKELSTF